MCEMPRQDLPRKLDQKKDCTMSCGGRCRFCNARGRAHLSSLTSITPFNAGLFGTRLLLLAIAVLLLLALSHGKCSLGPAAQQRMPLQVLITDQGGLG